MHENWACTRRSPEIKGVATHRSFPWFHTLPDWVWYFSNVMGKPRIHGCLFCSLSYEIIGFSFWLLSKYVIRITSGSPEWPLYPWAQLHNSRTYTWVLSDRLCGPSDSPGCHSACMNKDFTVEKGEGKTESSHSLVGWSCHITQNHNHVTRECVIRSQLSGATIDNVTT